MNGKRLIDADELIAEMAAGCIPIMEKGISGVTGDESTIKDYIDNARTVDAEPVRHGREARDRQEEALQTLKKSTDRKVNLKCARYNNARRVYELNQLVEANIGYNDLHVTATYPAPQYGMEDRSGEERRSREDALKDRRNYIHRVQRLLKRHGCDLNEFRWIAVTVSKEPDMEARNPFSPAHHHHILMHGVPEELRGEVERLWRFGYCNADRCQPDSKGPADLAGYVARQEGCANGDHKAGGKSYSTSRNIKQPEVRTADKKISKRRVAQLALPLSEIIGVVD